MQLKDSYFFYFALNIRGPVTLQWSCFLKKIVREKEGENEQSVKPGFPIWVDSVTPARVYFVKFRVC